MSNDIVDSLVGAKPMTESTLISVEDREKIIQLYRAAQGILSGKIVKVIVDGFEKAIDPLNLPVKDALYLLEKPNVTIRTNTEYGANVILLSTSNLDTPAPISIERVIKDTKPLDEFIASLVEVCENVEFIAKDSMGKVGVRHLGKGKTSEVLCYFVEVLNKADDATARVWFEILLDGKVIVDEARKDIVTKRYNASVYSWFGKAIYSLDPMCRIIDTRWANTVD